MPGLIQANFLDIALYFYVSGIKDIRPEFKTNKAIDQFIDKMKLDYTDFPTEHGQQVYNRMTNKFREYFKEQV